MYQQWLATADSLITQPRLQEFCAQPVSTLPLHVCVYTRLWGGRSPGFPTKVNLAVPLAISCQARILDIVVNVCSASIC